MSKKGDKWNIYYKLENNHYKFIRFWRGSDGSFYVEFNRLHRPLPQQQFKFNIYFEDGRFTSRITEKIDMKTRTDPIRVSYHTTGTVNYHGLERNTIYLEELTNITRENTFFMISIPSISSLDKESEPLNSQSQVIPIENISDQRINIYLSILPPKLSEPEKIDGLLMACDFQLATFVVVGDYDGRTFNFGEQVPERTFLFQSPHEGHYSSPALSENDAFLRYKKIIYQTDEAIILEPNGEGALRMIFIVEMRIPPFVKVEFENSDHIIKSVRRSKVDIWFEVYDSRKKAYVKKAEEIAIKSTFLDARFYDDDEVPPEGFI